MFGPPTLEVQDFLAATDRLVTGPMEKEWIIIHGPTGKIPIAIIQPPIATIIHKEIPIYLIKSGREINKNNIL